MASKKQMVRQQLSRERQGKKPIPYSRWRRFNRNNKEGEQ